MRKEKPQKISISQRSDNGQERFKNLYGHIQPEEQIRLLASVVEQSTDGMAIADMQGKIIFVNKTWVSMHGYDNAEELVGQNLSIFHNKKQLKEEVEPFNLEVKRKGSHSGEVEHVRKDGTIFSTQMTSSLLRNENDIPIAMTGVATDITKRKQVEESLRESEVRYRTLYNLLPYGGEVINTKGEIINCSPSTARMLGYEVSELIGQHITKLVDPAFLSLFRLKFPQLISGKPITVEIRMLRKDGTKLDILRAAQPILDKNGKVEAILALNVDISKRKKAESELKNKNKELQASIKRIRSINIELEKAREKAEESDRLKSAFLANMSHEIRTPMNGILGFANLLKDPKLTGEEHEMHIRIIEQSGHRMLNIINDLIDISKIESGQMEVSLTESKVNEQIEYIYSFFKHEAENKRLKISFNNDLPAEKSIINTDREKMYAILTNLVKNAIKYTHEGAIKFGYKKKGDFLEFYVSDSGIGIARDKQQLIFDRFVRADLSLSSQYEGAGLGLSITKAYVEMLGGKIWVKSEEHKGSKFYFTIPYAPPVCD
ncbi:MAG: PAS domain S-box protein [Bacteroidetes bacterium]|nr:PAS domain S-box protein [Bacteroidota bacterium]MCK5766480.1 PAS domain S-box protein [Bacteroidales bacterium]